VTFSIDDLANMEHDQDPDEYNDEALYDEEQDVSDIIGQQSGSANKGAINKGAAKGDNVQIAPEDSVSPADREFEDEDLEDQRETSFAAHASIKIERSGKGALVLEAAAEDGEFKIESVMFFPSSEMAEPKNAEQWWERRSLYTGPQFGTLDEDLQLLLERYLEERGINTRMALFIPDYIDYKEQKEYMRWLENVKSFVE
jgi:complement component 1 Q subcomponent-binding protein, mitochondrial